MATRSTTAGDVRAAARRAAAPFWARVAEAGLDRFFMERLLRALLRRWREDRFARVKQGGLHGDTRAELARVFVDLDATPARRYAGGAPRESERIVASWTRPPRKAGRGGRAGGPPALEARRSVPVEVVLGGPGQGKSTVGRFLTLIHASMLLLTSPFEGVAPVADLQRMEALLESLKPEGIPLPDVVRLPLWIELRELTDALLRDDESQRDALGATLRWYAAVELREADDATRVEQALAALPWVIVLDGLDEVPPEGGRALVRACVAGLHARFAGVDGRVIGTSRPQSYDRSVFGADLVERTLLPMTDERATLYTKRFAECIHAEEEGERALLLKRMQKALANPATAALMRNPLLVTIMATVVIHHGEPSDRRWTLFEDYYNTLYRRETERGTYASVTLREHASLITAIHTHVGLSLQARSEEASGVSALMPEHELRAIIHARLRESFNDEEATRLTAEILRAAEQRLVFLVQSQEGRYGFELRSFQEFMAAWAIVSLREAQVDGLLQRLAPLDAWRNVVLFAIGHQYATRSPLARERSVGLCEALDRGEDCVARQVKPGARLALSVLGDAPYGKASGPRDTLVARALELLHTPPGEVHLSLAYVLWEVAAERLLTVLDEVLRNDERAAAAWTVLLALPDDPRTRALAERYWPADRDFGRAVLHRYASLRAPSALGSRGGLWVESRVLRDATLSVPMEPEVSGDSFVSFRLKEGAAVHWVLSAAKRATPAGRHAAQIPRGEPWVAARAAAMFRENGTAEHLAIVLEELAREWSGRASWRWLGDVPWPLVACVIAAQSAEELRRIAERLRRGELGDQERWLALEKAEWTASLADVQALAASSDPLREILVEGRVPPFDPALGAQVISWEGGGDDLRYLRELDSVRRGAEVYWVRRMIARIELEMMRFGSAASNTSLEGSWPSVEDLVEIVETAASVDLATFSKLSAFMAPEDFVTVLARTTMPIVWPYSRGFAPVAQKLLPSLASGLRAAPGSARFQRALVVALQGVARRGRAPEITVEPEGDGVDAWLLRAISGHATFADASTLAYRLVASDDSHQLRAALWLLAAYDASRPLIEPVVGSIAADASALRHLRSEAVEFLADHVASAGAGLAEPSRWEAAGLPPPPPMTDPPERPDAPGLRFSHIEIQNLRAFPQRFEVSVPHTPEPGQWMVFLGENATGKTTLLRALALALASQSEASAVPSNLEGPLRRDALTDGSVVVRTADRREFKTTVAGPEGDERVVVTPEGALRPWVVGYGCRRGSAVSGTDMDNAFVPFRDLDNLFDRPRGVVRASGWLKELQRLAKNNGSRSRLVFEAAKAALKRVLLGAEEVIVADEVQVQFEGRRPVPLALLSDGYLTTAGWVVDLMARWLKRSEGRRSIDENFCASMEGVVLLDEIDLHLHPRWQERVIEDVRKLFPRMTFAVTTHHPLTLRGARAGEVFVLADHDGSGTVTARQRDVPPGTRVDQLITGEWFNRPSAIVDAETRAMLDEHQRLILAGAKAGDPKRKSLEAKLRARLGGYADTSLERLAATIVAQHLDGSLPEPSAKKREEVRERVLKILERRDAKRR